MDPAKLTPENSPPAKSPERGGGNLRKGVGAVKSEVLKEDSTPLNLEVRKGALAQGKKGGVGSGLAKRFSSQKKRRWLRFAKIYWPNVSQICAMTPCSTFTYYKHVRDDPTFAALVRKVADSVTDRIEGVMASEATNPKSFLDRMAYLRAHRPQLYDRAKKIVVEGYRMTDSEAGRRRDVLAGAVDAEIVKNYEDRKQKRQAKLEGGQGGGGVGRGDA